MPYERLTKRGGYTKELDLTQEYGYSIIYQRLSELEDKIERGELIELPFDVELGAGLITNVYKGMDGKVWATAPHAKENMRKGRK